jgi:hypothetical protein
MYSTPSPPCGTHKPSPPRFAHAQLSARLRRRLRLVCPTVPVPVSAPLQWAFHSARKHTLGWQDRRSIEAQRLGAEVNCTKVNGANITCAAALSTRTGR